MGAQQAVAELVEQSGLSKAELSRRTGISRSSLDDYLNGKRQPSVAQLERIGEAAGLKLDLMWTRAPVEYDSTPRWARHNPEMDPTPLTIEQRAQVLARAIEVAMLQRRSPRGELEFPPFRTLVRS